MVTSNQIKAYVARTFPGTRAQGSVHSVDHGSIQVFRDGTLILDFDVGYCGGFEIALSALGRKIRDA